MSKLYKQYTEGKGPAEYSSDIVNSIRRGRINGSELSYLIDELEQNSKLNSRQVDVAPKSEWDADYLQLLANKVIAGTFSKQYLLHLAEVADYVNSPKTNRTSPDNKQSGNGLLVAILAVAVTVLIAVIAVKTLNEKNTASASIYGTSQKAQIQKEEVTLPALKKHQEKKQP